MLIQLDISVTFQDGDEKPVRCEPGQVIDFPEETETDRQQLNTLLKRKYAHPVDPVEA